jgi:hypothetical protein
MGSISDVWDRLDAAVEAVGTVDWDGLPVTALLAEQAAVLRPDQLEKLAAQLALRLNPDGDFSDADRARKRGFTWSGGQGPDGMSVARLVATPELRAMLGAWAAKFAAPGMCNPDDQTPTVTGSTDGLPPPHLPLRRGSNTYHHPERMLPHNADGVG